MSKFIPSFQQANFLYWTANGDGSCILEAVAGAGKTTTIIEAVKKMSGVAILAYNTKIAEEIKGKLSKLEIGFRQAEAGTVHSFGFRAYRKQFPNVQVDKEGRKVSSIVAEMGTYASPDQPVNRYGATIVQLVGLAKQRALGITASIDDRSQWFAIINHFDLFADEEDAAEVLDEVVTIAIKVLKASNNMVDLIDFDDMVYLPVLLKVRFWQYRVIFVDEAQDTNPARRALVKALLMRGGRVIAVGDRHQAIYGFTGADSNSLDLIAEEFNAIRMPLTVTYRCPKSVVRFAQQWVSHIEADHSAPEGRVSSILQADLVARHRTLLTAGNAVLCRNTKPLVTLAFQLIREQIPCRVEGREIGRGLKKLATKWKRITTIGALEEKITEWKEKQTAALLAKGSEAKAQEIEDQAETVIVICDQCRKQGKSMVSDVVAYIDSLFGDDVTDMLVLSTIHKSKGREWHTVMWLDRLGTCPSKYARQAWQVEQEFNLCYVAATRAMEHLIEVKA